MSCVAYSYVSNQRLLVIEYHTPRPTHVLFVAQQSPHAIPSHRSSCSNLRSVEEESFEKQTTESERGEITRSPQNFLCNSAFESMYSLRNA